MAAVKIVEGEIFRDARGRISSLNDLLFVKDKTSSDKTREMMLY